MKPGCEDKRVCFIDSLFEEKLKEHMKKMSEPELLNFTRHLLLGYVYKKQDGTYYAAYAGLPPINNL